MKEKSVIPIIAVINRKGGSGKSTLSTHLAAWLARQGLAVMLGDVDRQQSTRVWLKRRTDSLPTIVPWAIDQKNVLKVPTGVTHVVLDTPGGIHGFELARVIMSADAVVMPLCNSLFDRDSAAQCLEELKSLPRISSGRCKLAIVGMRIDARTRAALALAEWSQEHSVPFLGSLRETQLYVRSLENGHTVFDLAEKLAATDLQQWAPILEWLRPIAKLPPVQPMSMAQTDPPVAIAVPNLAPPRQDSQPASRPPSLRPAQEPLIAGGRLGRTGANRMDQLFEVMPAQHSVGILERPSIPGFLLRH